MQIISKGFMLKHKCYRFYGLRMFLVSYICGLKKVTSHDSNVPSTHAERNATLKFEGTERA